MASIQGRPLRLLSLDGGGVKGLTSLLILERLFETIKNESGTSEIPKPCDYFDLIGGTSTGGLIAIMLGRLEMSIAECIAIYKSISGEVFAANWRHGAMKYFNAGVGRAWYKAEDLEGAVKRLLVDRGLDENIPLRHDDAACKVFVCATRTQNSQPELLRSYQNRDPSQRNYNCRLWEAVRATSAAPMFFDKITLQDGGADFVDGAMRLNNPIYELLREAERLYQPLSIGCILSLGTGWTNPTSLDDPKLHNVVRACAQIAVDAQQKADDFLQDRRGSEFRDANKYFRFNVEQGVQEIKLDEWKQLKTLDAMTTGYLSRNGKELQECARSLTNPTSLAARRPNLSTVPRDPNPNFTGRLEYLRNINRIFQSSNPLHQRVVLWGLGGVGKSQIALRYAQQEQTRLVVFWVRADSKANMILDYGRIAQKLEPTLTCPENSLKTLTMVRDQLEEEDRDSWLMILDSADDVTIFEEPRDGQPALSEFIPRTAHGRILVTSRDSRMAGLVDGQVVPAQNGISVASMSEAEGVDLLKQSIPQDLFNESEKSNAEQCARLASMLGGLPLALSQAAAFIRNERTSPKEFSRLYESARDHSELYRFPAYSQDKERQSVLLTWEVSYKRLGGQTRNESKPPSARLLDLMGYIDCQAIPKRLLEDIYSDHLQQANTSFPSTVGRLLNLCLVYQVSESEEYSIHPVVHEWIQRRLDPEEHRINASLVLLKVYHLFSNTKINTSARAACDTLLSHARVAVDNAAKHPDSGLLSEIAYDFAQDALDVHVLDAAIDLYGISISVAKTSKSGLGMSDRRFGLAQCLYYTGDVTRALAEAEAGLAVADENQSENIEEFIGICLANLGRELEAMNVQEQLLATRVRKYGENSENVALSKSYLANVIVKLAAREDSKGCTGRLDPTKAAHLYDEGIAIMQTLGKTDSVLGMQLAFDRILLETDQDIKQVMLAQLMEKCIEIHGHQKHLTLEIALQQLNGLYSLNHFVKMQTLAEHFLAYEPKGEQGVKLFFWNAISWYLGLSLQYQGDFAQSEPYLREALRRFYLVKGFYVSAQDIIDRYVYYLVVSLTAQRKDDEAKEIRLKYPGSVERAEEDFGVTITSLLERIAALNKPTEDTSAPKESKDKKPSKTRKLIDRLRI
ncbi:MAG: hypothetical protein M1812_007700 [Candelaria pacifica]|nr:MAG: hypothetical protein M1812_007700 [Candelaria pacifica]